MTTNETSKVYFKSLAIIYIAVIISQVFLGLVFYYLNHVSQNKTFPAELNKIFLILIPVLIVGAIVGSAVILRFRLKKLIEKADLKEKLREYRVTLLVNYAILEGPALLSLGCYYITANIIYLGLAGLIIVIFSINKPSKERVAYDLDLNPGERAIIEDPDAIVV
jgi:MFS family permease